MYLNIHTDIAFSINLIVIVIL